MREMPTSTTQSIVDYVRNHPGSSRAEIIKGIGYPGPPTTITCLLGRLREQKALEHHDGPPKNRRWWPVNNEDVIPAFYEMAEDILVELRELHPSVRQTHLAQRLAYLLGETIEEESTPN